MQAKSQAEHILSEANARIENTIRQIKEAQAEKEKTREIRRQLDEFKNSVGSEQIITTDDKITRKIQKIKEREEKKKQQSKHKEKKIFKPEVIEIGDAVRLKGQTSVGEVIAVDDKEVQVAFGMIKSTVKAERLEKVSLQPDKTGK